ncbi:MAG: hypothetical protein WAN48_09755 [Actinomycetes bacterium]
MSDVQLLRAARAELSEASAASRRAASLQAQLDDEQRQLAGLRAELREESDEVQALSRLSVTRLLAALGGRTDERRLAEQEDVDVLLIEIAARDEVVADLADQVAALNRLASMVEERQRRVDSLIPLADSEVRARGGADALRVAELARRIAGLDAQLREITEVQQAALDSDSLLRAMSMSLDSAASWSTYDTWLGGGMIASIVKHDRIDRAASQVGAVHASLRRLAAELADVSELPSVAPVEMSAPLRMMDIGFDNFFSDWMVAGRIDTSRESVTATHQRVLEIRRDMHQREASVTAERAEAQNEYLKALEV